MDNNNNKFDREDKILENVNYGKADDELRSRFQMRYNPFAVEGFTVPDRFSDDDIPDDAENAEMQRAVRRKLNEQLKTDPVICSRFLAEKILGKIAESIRREDGSLDARAMYAIIGSLGGYEIMRGIVSSIEGFTSEELFKVGVMVADTKDGGQYLLGDNVGNQVFSFCRNAVQDTSLSPEFLLPISKYCAENAGSDAYWSSPFTGEIPFDAKQFSRAFAGQYSDMLDDFTRYPIERVMTYAIAAAILLNKTGTVFTKDKALPILAEFCWRAAHFIG